MENLRHLSEYDNAHGSSSSSSKTIANAANASSNTAVPVTVSHPLLSQIDSDLDELRSQIEPLRRLSCDTTAVHQRICEILGERAALLEALDANR